MSKLSEMLRTQAPRRIPDAERLYNYNLFQTSHPNLRYEKEYELAVTISRRFTVREVPGNPQEESRSFYEMRKRCNRLIVHEVFSEFRDLLLELERSVLERDEEKTLSISKKLIDQIFD